MEQNTILYKSRELIVGVFQNLDMNDAQLTIHEAKLLNIILFEFQKNIRESLLFSFDHTIRIAQKDLIKRLGIDRRNASKPVGLNEDGEELNLIDKSFDSLLKLKIRLNNAMLPEFENGEPVVEYGIIRYKKYEKVAFNLLSIWKKERNLREVVYEFILNPFLVSLAHFQTLVTSGNGVGYAKLNLDEMQQVRSATILRLYEIIHRSKDDRCFLLFPESLEKLLFIKNDRKRFAVNGSLKKICLEFFDQFKIKLSFYICPADKNQKGIGAVHFSFSFPEDSDYRDSIIGVDLSLKEINKIHKIKKK